MITPTKRPLQSKNNEVRYKRSLKVQYQNNEVQDTNKNEALKKIPVGAKFSAPVQTGPGAHSASCTMGIGFFFPGVESGRGVTLNLHPVLAPRYKNRVELYFYSP
jgi:hypothetical protein